MPLPLVLLKRGLLALLLLGAGAVLVQDWSGVLLHFDKTYEGVPANTADGWVRVRLPDKTGRGALRVWESGERLAGPYRFLVELKEKASGFVVKERFLYVKPRAGHQEPYTFRVQLPRKMGRGTVLGAGALLAAVGLWALTRQTPSELRPSLAGKIDYLESLRGLACLNVCFSHFLQVYRTLPEGMADGGAGEWLCHSLMKSPLNVLFTGRPAVWLFFVLSGFVLALPFVSQPGRGSAEFRRAMVRRPVRLGGILLAVVCLSYLLWGTGAYPRPELLVVNAGPKPTFLTFLRDVFLGPFETASLYYFPFWTLKVELYGSLGLYTALWLCQGQRWRWAFYLLLGVLLFETYYLPFIVGAVLADAFHHGILPVRRQGKWLGAAALLLGLLLTGYTAPGPLFPGGAYHLDSVYDWMPTSGSRATTDLYLLIAATLILYGTLSLRSVQTRLGHSALVECGRLSYALYGLHGVIICSVTDLLFLGLAARGVGYWTAVAVAFTLYAPVLHMCSWLACRYIDQPSIKASRRFANHLLGPRETVAPPPP